MHVVTLLGSPRIYGNSAAIARHIDATAAGLGASTQLFELNQLNYRACQACYACKKGAERCVLRDDLTPAFAAVEAADLVVLASPVYYGDITAQLKGFFDRTFAFLKPDYRTNPEPSRLGPKKLILVLTQGHPDAAMFADIFPRYANFLRWQGFTDVELVRVCGIGPGNEQDSVPPAVLEQAAQTTRQLLG